MTDLPVTFTIDCSDSDLLDWLKNDAEEQVAEPLTTAHFGEMSEIPKTETLRVSPVEVIEIMYQVTGVIATVGGAVQFIDWICGKIENNKKRNKDKTLTIKSGTKQALVSTKKVQADNREELANCFETTQNPI